MTVADAERSLARVRIGAMEMRRGKVSGATYLVGFFGAVRIVARPDHAWRPDPDAPEVIAGYDLFAEELPPRSPYLDRASRAGRRPARPAWKGPAAVREERTPEPAIASTRTASPARQSKRSAQSAAARELLERLGVREEEELDDGSPINL